MSIELPAVVYDGKWHTVVISVDVDRGVCFVDDKPYSLDKHGNGDYRLNKERAFDEGQE